MPRTRRIVSVPKTNFLLSSPKRRRKYTSTPRASLKVKGYDIAGVSEPVKRYVKKAIHNMLETKQYTTEVAKTCSNFSNAANWQAGNVFQLTPSSATNALYTIVQGIGEGGRVGNSFKVVKAVVRMIMYPQLYNVTSNPTPKPLDVMVYICSSKKAVVMNTVSDLYTICNTTFYANGSSSNGMLGNLYDLVSVPNNEVVKVHKKIFCKLGASNAQLQTGVNAGWSNNDYKYNIRKTIDVTKYLPSTITFNDADNNSTSNQVFLMICPVNADGTGIASTTFPMSVFFGYDLYYEDA